MHWQSLLKSVGADNILFLKIRLQCCRLKDRYIQRKDALGANAPCGQRVVALKILATVRRNLKRGKYL